MRQTTVRAAVVACCLAAVAFTGVKLFADDAKKDMAKDMKPATQPAGTPVDMAAMMKAWEKYATPGSEHADLAKMEGEWTTEMEDLTPGMGGEKSTGTSTAKMIMGGRILQEEFKGTTMGMPFEGMALTGYDNQLKQYWSTWIDSMGTGIMTSRGTASGDKMEMNGQMTCPMHDKPGTTHSVLTEMGPDKHVLNMTMTGPDGSMMGAMRITYTRKK